MFKEIVVEGRKIKKIPLSHEWFYGILESGLVKAPHKHVPDDATYLGVFLDMRDDSIHAIFQHTSYPKISKAESSTLKPIHISNMPTTTKITKWLKN